MNCQKFGTFSVIIDGKTISARGAWNIKLSNREYEAEMNMDSTMYMTEKPVPAEATGSFSGAVDDDLVGQCGVTAEFSFDDGDTFVFADAAITGRAEFNMETGETTGIMIKSPRAWKQ